MTGPTVGVAGAVHDRRQVSDGRRLSGHDHERHGRRPLPVGGGPAVAPDERECVAGPPVAAGAAAVANVRVASCPFARA